MLTLYLIKRVIIYLTSMKNLKSIILIAVISIGIQSLNAQDKNNPWSVGFGTNAIDFYPTNVDLAGHGTWFEDFFDLGPHYNFLPSISKLSVGRYLEEGFSLEASGILNRIDMIGENEIDEMSYFGLDGAVKYDLNNVFGESKIIDPYASVGGGYLWYDNSGTASFNGGLGLNVWFNDNIGLNVETKYKHTFGSMLLQHFQHSLGVVVQFGGVDTDGDTVYDKYDACPEVFGLVAFNGCPDSDDDGIIDEEDDCPETPGLESLNGCPDADEDGIADKDDNCPNVKGSAENKGCPDTDGDGLIDKEDDCPNVSGPSANKGCPWPDTDNDGILDKDDSCVDQAGPASNNGCPEISESEVTQLQDLFKLVFFETGEDQFIEETPSKLKQASAIMVNFSTAKFAISGHADSVGSAKSNLELSERRANKVMAFLVENGVNPSNLTANGYGEENPVASNNTKKGRAENRRVEIKLVK